MGRPKKVAVQAPPNGAAKVWGKELNLWRTRAGLTQAQLAARLFCDQSLISGWETGKVIPSPEQAQQLDEVLNTGGVLLRNLEYVSRDVSDYHPDWFQNYMAMEAQGLALYEWYPYSVPSLLQTEQYMRQQMRGWHVPSRVDQLTEARLSRQERLFESNPLELQVVVDECALRHRVGPAGLMSNQLAHLLRVTSRPNVTVQIVPLGRELPIILHDMVAFLHMPDGTRWFYTEGLDRGRYTAEAREVADFTRRYDVIRGVALPVPESRDLIRRALEETTNMPQNIDLSSISIFKSSYSNGGNGCVGTSRDLLASGLAPIVDTTLGSSSPVLPFTTAAFASFVSAVKAGDPAFAFGEQYVTP